MSIGAIVKHYDLKEREFICRRCHKLIRMVCSARKSQCDPCGVITHKESAKRIYTAKRAHNKAARDAQVVSVCGAGCDCSDYCQTTFILCPGVRQKAATI
jgi:hypothetical protein